MKFLISYPKYETKQCFIMKYEILVTPKRASLFVQVLTNLRANSDFNE